MFGLFRKTDTKPEGVLVIARLTSRIEPMDRGEIFEDPLAEILQGKGFGHVTGGGSMLDGDGEITYIDIEIVLESLSDPALDGITAALESLGAPKGSLLHDADEATLREFGKNEGLGIYLDGANLPDEVYQTVTTEDVVDACHAALGEAGRYHGSRTMAERTALYFYGPDFETMKAGISGILSENALCQNAVVKQVA